MVVSFLRGGVPSRTSERCLEWGSGTRTEISNMEFTKLGSACILFNSPSEQHPHTASSQPPGSG